LMADGVYTRTQSVRNGVQWDDTSEAPCSTDFSIARFWVPHLAGSVGWALYCDCDFLWRADVGELFGLADPRYAVMVVPHQHAPSETVKMDGQPQTVYPRKNWSSLVLWNLGSAGARRLDHEMLNTLTGRDLHRFCWLNDAEIGFLPERWNWLDGTSDEAINPAAVHMTRGTPDMPDWGETSYAGEWSRYALGFTHIKSRKEV
jgi:lipopolysaccharide biosynthesis glycosyltransferase